MDGNTFFEFISNLLNGFVNVSTWLVTPLVQLGDFQFTPLMLFTFAGLTAFITIAVIKWGIS